MALIQFTRNYNDLSTDAGFQFEFYCDHCDMKMDTSARFCAKCGTKQ